MLATLGAQDGSGWVPPPPPCFAKFCKAMLPGARKAAFSTALLTPAALANAVVVTSDASADGFGYWYADGAALPADRRSIAVSAGHFPQHIAEGSSTLREAWSVRDFLLQHRQLTQGRAVVVMTDNAGLAYAINSGVTRSPHMKGTIRDILDAADEGSSPLLAMWVPREANTFADFLSRLCPAAESNPVNDIDICVNSLLSLVGDQAATA